MAGGHSGPKMDPKKINLYKANTNEVLKDTSADHSPSKITLSGILGLNQTVEINPEIKTQSGTWNTEFLLPTQEKQILSHRHQEMAQNLEDLRQEIEKLATTTQDLDKKVQDIALENIPEVSEYQLNFLRRIKNFIINFRKNLSEADNWLAVFNTKKKKRNYFWSTARNKKQGGEQYLASGEHSASRSVN